MKRNLFEVGEIVILESENYPELNGEYPVVGVYFEGLALLASGGFEKDTFVYELHGVSSDIEAWVESALRKKYKPSSEDFRSMMNTLKTNIIERVE